MAVSEALYIVLSEAQGGANIWNLDDVVAEMQQKNAADQIEVLPAGVKRIPLSAMPFHGRGGFHNYSGIGGNPNPAIVSRRGTRHRHTNNLYRIELTMSFTNVALVARTLVIR